jgi:hypothetical protein
MGGEVSGDEGEGERWMDGGEGNVVRGCSTCAFITSSAQH